MAASLGATAYNGRYVMIGAAADKTTADEPFIVPRQVMGANMRLCGVLLAYAVPEIRTLVKQAMGFNFLPREVGERITAEVVERVRAGRVRAVVGATVEFGAIPEAITAMAERRPSAGRWCCCPPRDRMTRVSPSRVGEERADPAGDDVRSGAGRGWPGPRATFGRADELDPPAEQVVGEGGHELGVRLDRPGPRRRS